MAKIQTSDLPRLARIYNAHVDSGNSHRATQETADVFGVSRHTVIRHLRAARSAGLIPDFADGHRPIRVRQMTKGYPAVSWVACEKCHAPWPCKPRKWAVKNAYICKSCDFATQDSDAIATHVAQCKAVAR